MIAVRWYLRFGLSYRDVEELLAERGIEVDHLTVYRWVQWFTPAADRCGTVEVSGLEGRVLSPADYRWVTGLPEGIICSRRVTS
jgi:hypothetical protein